MPSQNRFCVNSGLVIAWSATAGAQTEHARFELPVAIEGRQHVLTYDATHDITKDVDARIKLVVFVHHGGSQNARSYFRYLTSALDSADRDRPSLKLKATTLVISPLR
ncbi:MAG: hypothetical protein ACT4P6_19375 [Gemmatimonadaceae bacterium]